MTNFKNVTKTTVFSEVQFYTVETINANSLVLKNEAGESIEIGRSYVEGCLVSADQFSKEEPINHTQAAEIFSSNPGVVMTVSYQKKVDEKDVLKEILDVHTNTAPKDVEKAFKKAVKTALNGEERVIVGYHKGHLDEFGRMRFVDMYLAKDTSKAYDTRSRLVDPRTINHIILNDTKYNVK